MNITHDNGFNPRSKPQLILTINREPTKNGATLGKMYINGEYFCETLEDPIRDKKIDGDTCIPSGIYDVKLTMSSRFKRMMPLVYNTSKLTVENKGMSFSGVRLHGGNTAADTHGCPLVAYRRVNDHTIQGTAEKELTAKIQAAIESGKEVKLEIFNP